MPAAPLDLEEAIETTVFRALVEVLRNDPVLFRVVKTWEVLDGRNPNLQPPTTSMMPWIRVMGGPSDMGLAEASAWGLEYDLYLVTATAGLNQDDQTNLWGAIRKALSYNKPFNNGATVEQHLRSAGSVCHTLSRPGFGARPMPTPETPSPAQDLFGSGHIGLKLVIPF